MKSLLCAVCLLWIIMYVVAIYFTQVSVEYRLEPDPDPILAESLEGFFGSIWTSQYFLFQSMSGGISWGEVAQPLVSLHWSFSFVFSLFICFTTFAVLNIVTAVFCENAMACAQSDRDV